MVLFDKQLDRRQKSFWGTLVHELCVVHVSLINCKFIQLLQSITVIYLGTLPFLCAQSVPFELLSSKTVVLRSADLLM